MLSLGILSDPVVEPLLDAFTRCPVRERGGPRASNRLTYQTSWAFCLLLDLHSSKNDFLIILDYHDDIVVFDSVRDPKTMDFFQVKTRKGKSPWKIPDLLRVAKKSTHSIWGKMYLHRVAFGDGASSLNLVSDAGFNVQLKGKTKPEEVENCTLAELCVESLRAVAVALQEQLELPYCPLLDIHTALRKDSLSVDEHTTHAKGRFIEFLERSAIPTKEVSAAFKSLLHELQKRSNCESAFTASDDLKAKKGFSKSEFDSLLLQMKQAADTEAWDTISQQLTVDGLDIITLKCWRRAWSTYRVERLDFSNEILQKAAGIVEKIVNQAISDGVAIRPLTHFVQTALARCQARLALENLPLDHNKIIAIILSALDEIEQPPTFGS